MILNIARPVPSTTVDLSSLSSFPGHTVVVAHKCNAGKSLSIYRESFGHFYPTRMHPNVSDV
jgi:hypothetical protein